MTPIVEFREYSAWYGASPSLQKITLEVRPNEILGVIGPAGGGKTTLLRSLNRMNDFEPAFRCDGTATFRGIDLYRRPVDVAVLRRRLGMVFAVPCRRLFSYITQASCSNCLFTPGASSAGSNW